MAAVLYGTLSAPAWGTTDETAIIITNLQKDTNSEEATLPDGQGDIQHVAYHGKNIEATCDFKVKATGYPDGDDVTGTITLADSDIGQEFAIMSVSNTKQRGEWFGGSMRLRAFPAINLTP